MRKALGAGIAVCGVAACALVARQPQRLPDGSFRATCDAPLTTCLQVFERVCESHGYDVLSASEARRRDDVPQVPSVVITSEALIRCKQAQPLFGGAPPPSP